MNSAPEYFVIHGSYGHPEENWLPWLKKELEKNGAKVAIPQFPTPNGQSFEEWLPVAEAALMGGDPGNTVLIGHSIGAIFAMRLAELAARPYKAVSAVSPFARDLGLDAFDPMNGSFYRHAFDWPRIRKNAGKILCLAGDDDPYVPLAYAQEVADNCGVELTVVKKGGHLNAKAGYLSFPLLLEQLKRI